KPLASGYLTGKYQVGDRITDPGDLRSREDPQAVREKLEAAERLGRTEVPAGSGMARWALAWCLLDPAVTCVIPGCKDVGQVQENAEAASLAVTGAATADRPSSAPDVAETPSQ